MRMTSCVLGLLAALAATEASAQLANLNGKYVCVQNCRSGAPGGPAYVTQNGWDLNLLDDAGNSSRAWSDWFTPNRIWAESLNQGAVFSPDGMTIQFDRGMLWQRDLGMPPAPLPPRRKKVSMKAKR